MNQFCEIIYAPLAMSQSLRHSVSIHHSLVSNQKYFDFKYNMIQHHVSIVQTNNGSNGSSSNDNLEINSSNEQLMC